MKAAFRKKHNKGGDSMIDTEFQDIQQAYESYCSGIIRRILSDPRDCEECLNDVWLRVWKSIDSHNPTNLKGWLGTIARNCAITRYRQLAFRNAQWEDSIAELLFSLQDGPAEQLEHRALGEAISRFLGTQTREQRIAFVRRYWYGDTMEQTANHLGWSVSKTKTVLFRTRNKLKTYLVKEELFHG